MGTHPIFESDFDCLTEWVEVAHVPVDAVARRLPPHLLLRPLLTQARLPHPQEALRIVVIAIDVVLVEEVQLVADLHQEDDLRLQEEEDLHQDVDRQAREEEALFVAEDHLHPENAPAHPFVEDDLRVLVDDLQCVGEVLNAVDPDLLLESVEVLLQQKIQFEFKSRNSRETSQKITFPKFSALMEQSRM